MENCNEPDKWWEGRAGFFTPGELAAMCSADYDGHRGTMGPTAGVKTADPTIQLVLGGLANPEIEYLKAMQLWADFHRDGAMPFDVINLHHYSNDAGGQGGRPTKGISPEADGLRERFAQIVAWRDRYLPGKKVWVSEFGYDTNPKSTFRAPAIGTFRAPKRCRANGSCDRTWPWRPPASTARSNSCCATSTRRTPSSSTVPA